MHTHIALHCIISYHLGIWNGIRAHWMVWVANQRRSIVYARDTNNTKRMEETLTDIVTITSCHQPKRMRSTCTPCVMWRIWHQPNIRHLVFVSALLILCYCCCCCATANVYQARFFFFASTIADEKNGMMNKQRLIFIVRISISGALNGAKIIPESEFLTRFCFVKYLE